MNITRYFKYNPDKLIRALRIFLAIAIAELVYILYKEPYYSWVLITIYVVLFDQATLGGTLYRGFLRLVATISGATIGCLTLLIFKNNEIANLVVLLLASFVYSYIYINQKQSYIGILGLATLAMILINTNGIEMALYRSGNIILGILIAIGVTLTFFPQSAEKVALKLIYQSIVKFRDTMQILLENNNDKKIIKQHFDKIENEILTELNSLVKNIDEVMYEGKSHKKLYYLDALQAIRRIYRIITVLFQSESYTSIFNNQDIRERLLILQEYYISLTSSIEDNLFPISQIDLMSTTEDKTIVNHDLTFINNLINRIYTETDVLIKAINLVKT